MRESAEVVEEGVGVDGGRRGGRRDEEAEDAAEAEVELDEDTDEGEAGWGKELLLAGGRGAEVWRYLSEEERTGCVSWISRQTRR